MGHVIGIRGTTGIGGYYGYSVWPGRGEGNSAFPGARSWKGHLLVALAALTAAQVLLAGGGTCSDGQP